MKRAQALEKAVSELLDLHSIPYIRVSSYRCFKCGQVQNSKAAGFPDFFCLDPLLAIECKTGTGRLTKDQKTIKGCMEKNGLTYVVAKDTIDAVVEYLNEQINNARRMNKKGHGAKHSFFLNTQPH